MKCIIGNEETSYYNIKEYLLNPNNYSFKILWNPEIIGGSQCSGYIVQEVDVSSTNPHIRIENKPYFEAWRVFNGSTGNTDYDDSFDCPWVIDEGVVTYVTKVYWIDKNDNLYTTVSKWKNGTVRMANELPSSYDFSGLKDRLPVLCRFFKYDNRGMNNEEITNA